VIADAVDPSGKFDDLMDVFFSQFATSMSSVSMHGIFS